MSRTWARSFTCQVCGERHFGLGGAAGILLVRRDNSLPGNPATHVVLQLRADTNSWAIPGGVLDYQETPRQAALREAAEEVSLPFNCTQGRNPLVNIRHNVALLDHGQWKYTTFIADVNGPFEPIRPAGDTEGLAVAWAPIDEVGLQGGRYFPLHTAFWADWDTLRGMIRAMDGPTQPVQPVNQPLQPTQIVQPILHLQPAQSSQPTQPDQPSLGFPVTVGPQQTPDDQPNPGVLPTTLPGVLPAPSNLLPTLGFPQTHVFQPNQPVQGINTAHGVQPTPPAPVPHDPPAAPTNTGAPDQPRAWIIEDDEYDEEWRNSIPQQTAGDNKGVHGDPGDLPAPHQNTPTPHQHAPPAPHHHTPPAPDHHVPPAPHHTAPPSVEDDEDYGAIYVGPRVADRSFAGGQIGYMAWKQYTAPGSTCQPS